MLIAIASNCWEISKQVNASKQEFSYLNMSSSISYMTVLLDRQHMFANKEPFSSSLDIYVQL
jgi:hypothetical protein